MSILIFLLNYIPKKIQQSKNLELITEIVILQKKPKQQNTFSVKTTVTTNEHKLYNTIVMLLMGSLFQYRTNATLSLISSKVILFTRFGSRNVLEYHNISSFSNLLFVVYKSDMKLLC